MKSLLIAALILFPMVGSVKAADVDNNISVRVEQPQSPTRLNEWKLSFSVLDRAMRTPSVSCYVKKPGSGSFVQFDSTKVSSKSTGDNGYCQVNSSIMSEQGSYEFFATANAGSDSEASSTVTVSYDTSGPGTPDSYSKEHSSMCRWVIKFHTADDNGATTKVEIYSSDQKNFDTNDGSRVGTVNIGSDQDGSFTHDRADGCDKEWYYVIRAFDSAGNQSNHVGDAFVTITSSTTTASPTAALVVTRAGGSVLGQDQTAADESSESGKVLGSDQQGETVEGTGLIEGVKDAVSNASSTKKLWWIFDILAIVVIVYVLSRKIKST